MAAPAGQRPRPTHADVRAGAYLTDGKRLLYVATASDTCALLEDSRHPGELESHQVVDIVKRMELVRAGPRDKEAAHE